MTKVILAIDDEPELLDILVRHLQTADYKVVTATGGTEGIQLAKDVNPDLIILDIAMPKMDGFDVLARLRGHRETATVPVVMLTSKGMTHNILESQKYVVSDFLIKPFEPAELLEVVHRNIRQ